MLTLPYRWPRKRIYRLLAIIVALVPLRPATAGDMDTHLIGTYTIARLAGYSHAEAKTIAEATWSVDINSKTTVWPVTTPGYVTRARVLHSLGFTREDVHTNLSHLSKGAQEIVSDPKNGKVEKLIAVGQYLHSLQDAYFHQSEGRPYNPVTGHLLQGHNTDKIVSHADAALRANMATYDALKQFMVSNQTALPAPPTVAKLYARSFAHGELEAIHDAGIWKVTEALANGYDRYDASPQANQIAKQYGALDLMTRYELNPTRATENVSAVWKSLRPDDTTFRPPAPITSDSPNKINYDVRYDLLARHVPGVPRTRAPGGVSLSVAAAERMPINIDLEGVHFRGDKIVMSGSERPVESLDAALLLTAMRLACEPGDPYFSLDPPNGLLWQEEGRKASAALMKLIDARRKQSTTVFSTPGSKKFTDGLSFETFSARRDYPELWLTFAAKYPSLKSQLVFRPAWLRATRFGEILYRADVLLKEISGGVPSLDVGSALRANKIDRYMSGDARNAARSVLATLEKGKTRRDWPDWRGQRLWFDLLGTPEDPLQFQFEAIPETVSKARRTGPAESLERELTSRGFYGSRPGVKTTSGPLAFLGNSVDVSGIYAKMYVRTHDQATGRDVPGKDLDLDGLADDLNSRPAQYIRAHEELRALNDIFRVYVAAVGIAKYNPEMCGTIKKVPLVHAERARQLLPEFHPTELFVTIATYIHSHDGRRYLTSASVRSTNGGISLRGKFMATKEMSISTETPVIKRLNDDIASGLQSGIAKPAPGRLLVTFTLDKADGLPEFVRLRSFTPVELKDLHETERSNSMPD